MKLGLIGPTYRERSLPFDAQRTVNLYPVIHETGQGKEPAALYGTPGLDQFSSGEIGTGPIRAEFASANGRAFVVSGSGLFEVSSDGTSTQLGTLDSNASICSIDENFTQMGICDGEDVYILTYADNSFTKVTDANFPGAATITFQDQYFIVNKPETGEFYLSDIADGLGWDALRFATAESSPDDLVRVFSAYGQLWLLGDVTTEVFYNSGASFPFVRVEGAKMQVGCASPFSVVDLDNSVFWIGRDEDGTGIVYRAQGYTALRVSNRSVERALAQVEDLTKIRAYSYQEDGHLFYAITGEGLETTWVFDVSTQLWHERAYLEADGMLSPHRANTHMFAFGKHLVGDRENGNVYDMALSHYSDNGDEILRQRTFTHFANENTRFTVNEIQVDFEAGVGLKIGQGSDPQALLEVSNNGGRTWSPQYRTSIGRVGEFKARAVWRRLGQFDLLTGRISVTDPVKVAIAGAYWQ